jgi:hypothetical protein
VTVTAFPFVPGRTDTGTARLGTGLGGTGGELCAQPAQLSYRPLRRLAQLDAAAPTVPAVTGWLGHVWM